jgi:hypothetical protein
MTSRREGKAWRCDQRRTGRREPDVVILTIAEKIDGNNVNSNENYTTLHYPAINEPVTSVLIFVGDYPNTNPNPTQDSQCLRSMKTQQ